MLTYVLAADGSPLMPTYNIKKVRRMLKDGRAVIAGHKPGFTIQLTYALPDQKTPHTQKVELCEDTGYQHIGVSVKSKKHEYVHMQVDTLTDEKDHHDAQRRYRRNRRNRLRYRAPRFDNRTHSKKPGWLAPSLQHKADIHVRLVSMFQKVLPIRDVYLEVGSFDTQILEAKERAFQFLKDRTISMESVTVLQRFVKRYFIVTVINASAAAKESKMAGFCVCTIQVTGKHRPIIQTGWPT